VWRSWAAGRASARLPSAAWRIRAVFCVAVSEGIHQPASWGMAVSSMSKWTSVKGRLREAGVVDTVREGWRTSCHWPCANRTHMVA